MIRVTVWNEYVHEREDAAIAAVYPEGIHGAVAAALGGCEDITVRTATLYDAEGNLTPDCGLPGIYAGRGAALPGHTGRPRFKLHAHPSPQHGGRHHRRHGRAGTG